MSGRLYKTNIPFEEARILWFNTLKNRWRPLPEEQIKTPLSKGRIASRPVYAKISSPHFHASAVDGYAVNFSHTVGASEKTPVYLCTGRDALRVDTGDPIPQNFNAVVMLEDINIVNKNGSEYIELREALTPWQNVRIAGEDILTGELILSENERITAFHIGAMLATLNTEIWVRKRLVVGIIPTGSEMVEPVSAPKPGNLIEFNSGFLSCFIDETGSMPIKYPIVPDDKEILRKTLEESFRVCDIVLIIGGSSLGREDYTPDIINSMGEVIVHSVNIKPGKPVLLGLVKDKPVVGIPGYPVSAYISFELFVRPAIYMLQSIEPPQDEQIEVILSRNVASTLGVEEFIRVKIGSVADKYVATPLARGAGLLSSLLRADGILQIPSQSEGLSAGSKVSVRLLRKKEDLQNTIVFIGSHDNTIDILSNQLRKYYPKYSLSSANVGSMGGLIALKRRECHITGTHLLDEATGEYNIPFINRLLSEDRVIVINLVYRQQGLMVKKGNPKGIRGFEDLTRDDIIFINRQRGSGTRLLLDKYLKELGIDSSKVKGYDIEDFTHMAVASRIATGVADTGLGIYSAARAFGLDFIPVAEERYDVVILEEYMGIPMIQAILEILRNDNDLRRLIEGLGGYDTRDMGKVIMQAPPERNLSESAVR